MKIIRNIIKSQSAPQNKNELWLRDGVLYEYTNTGWKPLTQSGITSNNNKKRDEFTNTVAGFDLIPEIITDQTTFDIVTKNEYPPSLTTVARAYSEPDPGEAQEYATHPKIHYASYGNIVLFQPGDTILVQGVYGYEPDGITQAMHELILYVISEEAYQTNERRVQVRTLNGKKIDNFYNCLPSISRGAVLTRMGKTYSEGHIEDEEYIINNTTDIYDPQYSSSSNVCQYFVSVLHEDESQINGPITDKTILNEEEKRVLQDFLLGRNKSLLFGQYHEHDENDDDDFPNMCNGLWYQAGKEYAYGDDGFTKEAVVELTREMFAYTTSTNTTKILVCGSELFSYFNQLDYTQIVYQNNTSVDYGMVIATLNTGFGNIILIYNTTFDECGMEPYGLSLDLSDVVKYTKTPLNGVFTTDENDDKVLVLSEESCIVMHHPRWHMRIVKM